MNFGDSIKNARMKQKMTQEDLARLLFVDRSLVSRWESNKSIPSDEHLKQLKEILDIEELVEQKEKNDWFQRDYLLVLLFELVILWLTRYSSFFYILMVVPIVYYLYKQEKKNVFVSIGLVLCLVLINVGYLRFTRNDIERFHQKYLNASKNQQIVVLEYNDAFLRFQFSDEETIKQSFRNEFMTSECSDEAFKKGYASFTTFQKELRNGILNTISQFNSIDIPQIEKKNSECFLSYEVMSNAYDSSYNASLSIYQDGTMIVQDDNNSSYYQIYANDVEKIKEKINQAIQSYLGEDKPCWVNPDTLFESNTVKQEKS